MGVVTRWAALSIVLVTAPAQAETVADWRPFVTDAAQRFGVPVAWIEHVMQAESAGRTTLNGRALLSRAGAMGLMQLMPATWADMRRQLGLGANPFDPHDNILAGTCYLRLLYDRFGYPGLFAAYNAGPERYQAYLAGRARLPDETIAYWQNVTGSARRVGPPGSDVPKPRLFVALATRAPPAPQEPNPAAADGLFVVRHRP